MTLVHWDSHENFNLVQHLRGESDLIRKLIFYFYFLDMTIDEIAKELDKSEIWVDKKIKDFKEQYNILICEEDKWKPKGDLQQN